MDEIKIKLQLLGARPDVRVDGGPESLTLCTTNNITLLGAALIVNSVDVLATTSKLTGQVAALLLSRSASPSAPVTI